MARTIALIVVAACAVLAGAGFLFAWRAPIEPISPPDPKSFEPALVRRGAELAALGNCNTCHTAPGGKSFAGGVARADAVRHHLFHQHHARSADRHRALVGGGLPALHARRGGPRRAAISIRRFRTIISRCSPTRTTSALYAYLMSREPVRAARSRQRSALSLQHAHRCLRAGSSLFCTRAPTSRSPRAAKPGIAGAYLVEGLAHCGACHTPRNAFGAEKKDDRFGGGEAEGWTAYALNGHLPRRSPWDAKRSTIISAMAGRGAHGAGARPHGSGRSKSCAR